MDSHSPKNVYWVAAVWTALIFISVAIVKIVQEEDFLSESQEGALLAVGLLLLSLVDKKRGYVAFALALALFTWVIGDTRLAAASFASSILRGLLEFACTGTGLL